MAIKFTILLLVAAGASFAFSAVEATPVAVPDKVLSDPVPPKLGQPSPVLEGQAGQVATVYTGSSAEKSDDLKTDNTLWWGYGRSYPVVYKSYYTPRVYSYHTYSFPYWSWY